MSKKFELTIYICLWLATLVLPSHAKVARVTIDKMIDSSTYIVIGHVKTIFEVEKIKIAEIEPIKTLKGDKDQKKLYVLAQSTWACDISHCLQDEKAIFFLRVRDNYSFKGFFKEPDGFREALNQIIGDAPFCSIYHSGRGRMPITNIDGKDYATTWTGDVLFPENFKIIDRIDGRNKSSFIKSVELTDMVELIENRVKTVIEKRSDKGKDQ